MSKEENEILGLFVQETTGHLETIKTVLVALEAAPKNSELLNRLLRAIHRVKGPAGFFRLTPITDLAHVMEGVLALLRDGRRVANHDLIKLLLTGTGKLKAMVAAPDQASSIDTSAERTALHALLHTEPPKKAPAPYKRSLPLYLSGLRIDPELVRNAHHCGQNTSAVQLHLHEDIEFKGQALIDYFRDIEALATLIDTAPEMGGLEDVHNVGGDFSEEDTADVIYARMFTPEMELGQPQCAFNLPENQLSAVPSELLQAWLNTQPTLAPTQSAPAAQVHSAPTASVPPASAPPTSAPTATVVSSTVAATPAPAPTSTSITPTPFSPAVPAAPAQGAKPKTGDTERVADALLDGIMSATTRDQGTAPQVGLAGLRERVSMVTDASGKVVAANTCDATGKPIQTAFLLGKDMSKEAWFRDNRDGRFLKSATLDGTVVEDVSRDPDAVRLLGSDALVIGYSAPITNDAGQFIGTWRNLADFSLVEQVIVDSYELLKDGGLGSIEFALIDKKGLLLAEYDPHHN